MLRLLRVALGAFGALLRPRTALLAENLALRHQIGVLLRSKPAHLPLTSWDRALWAFVLRRLPGWRKNLILVRPETVIAWHRQAFRLFCTGKSQAGRPSARAEVRRLIRKMASENPTWGAPRIHGELLKLGFDVSERTVSRYLERIRPEPRRTGSQTWKTFLRNQAKGIVAIDLLSAPTATASLASTRRMAARREVPGRCQPAARRPVAELGSSLTYADDAILASHNRGSPSEHENLLRQTNFHVRPDPDGILARHRRRGGRSFAGRNSAVTGCDHCTPTGAGPGRAKTSFD